MSIVVASTTPSYSFTLTRDDLCERIMRKLGVLAAGETAEAEDAEVVHEAIDLRLKEFHRLGTLWYQVSGGSTDVALTASVATANAPEDCLFPISASLRIGNDDQPIDIIGHRQYQAIPNKLDTGEPDKVFFSGGVLRFWPVPNSAYTVKLTYQAIAANTVASTAVDVEQSMLRALTIICAADLVDDFGVPEAKAQRLLAQVDSSVRTILALNAERTDFVPIEAEYF